MHTTVIRAADQRDDGKVAGSCAPKSDPGDNFALVLRFPTLLSETLSRCGLSHEKCKKGRSRCAAVRLCRWNDSQSNTRELSKYFSGKNTF